MTATAGTGMDQGREPVGPDEAREGALARITPEVTVAAVGLVRTGEIEDLGSVLSRDMPRGGGDEIFAPFQVLRHRTTGDINHAGEDWGGTTFSTELVMGTPHVGTHIDAFSHCQHDGAIYGGATAREAEGDFGWRSQAIHEMRPIMTRGVLVDVAGHRGIERLADHEEIGADEVRAVLDATGVTIQPGDAVMVRTGKMREYGDPAAFVAGQPGLGVDAAIWLHERGMAALGADNTSVEPQPVPDWGRNLHVEMLVRRGVPLMEWLDLEGLHRRGATTFLFTCLPLKIRGATGSWVRPIATF
ncbi:MAG: cyclase family protein [Thermomicrobiales bacterium]